MKSNWWEHAQQLAAQGHWEQAEKTIVKSSDDMGVYSQCAYLYELHFATCLKAGDLAGAKQAMDRADYWLSTYASGATSGGEGIALSTERRDRLAKMRKALKAAQ